MSNYLDGNIVFRAKRYMHGANIHCVSTMIACYKNSHWLGENLGWNERRIEAFQEYEKRLVKFIYENDLIKFRKLE